MTKTLEQFLDETYFDDYYTGDVLWAIKEWLTQKRQFCQDYKFAHGCPANQRQQGQIDTYNELLEELTSSSETTGEKKQ